MFAIFECIGRAVMNRGIRGLVDFLPGGGYLIDVAGDAFRLFRERRRNAEFMADIQEEVAKAAAASTEEAKQVAGEVAREVAAAAPPEDRLALELYLTQIPGSIRQSLKRAEDPSGKTVPADLALNTPEDLMKLLPHRVPHFRPGADLPGRSGWQLDDLIGAGGFGEVWLARHTFIPNRRGAVKFCTDPLARAKLTSHEGKVIARVMAQGDHPNVVPLMDAVLDGEAPWLMYEYVGGGNLTDLVHTWQGLPPADRERHASAALHELAAAVGTFHRLSPPIVHRDLKPSNILLEVASGKVQGVSEDGSTSAALAPRPSPLAPARLRITDFGIGGVAVEYMRTHNPRGLSLLTGWLETSLRGSYTPLYASPQQRAGNPPDPRDDVHALGVMGYQMLTGDLNLAPGIDAAEDLRDAGAGEPLIALLTRCVAQKPNRRPKDAAELAEKLAEFRGASPRSAAKPVPVSSGPAVNASTPVKPPFIPVPMEGGPVAFSKESLPTASPARPGGSPPSSAGKEAGGAGQPVPPKPTKWSVTVGGQWYSRPADADEVAWSAQPAKLPGEVTVRPNEAYRLALSPTASDKEMAGLRVLSGVAGLEAIDASGCAAVTDAGLAHLAALPNLKAVGLAETAVSDSGVALLLTRFPNLEAVSLAGAVNVSPAVVPYLARLRKLKLLALSPRTDTVDVRVELARRLPGCKLV